MLQNLTSRIVKHFFKSSNHDDIKSLIQLEPLLNQYLPWSTSAMRPSAVVKILNEIIINNRVNVIEFGSGLTTIYIAATLRQINSNSIVVSVEHDLEWIEICQRIIDQENLTKFVQLVHAPMELSNYSIDHLPWYSEACIKKVTRKCRFNMAVVDGPLAHTKKLKMSRYPALPFLIENKLLDDNHRVYLDDVTRSGERKIIKMWERKFGFKFKKDFNLGIASSKVVKSYTT